MARLIFFYFFSFTSFSWASDCYRLNDKPNDKANFNGSTVFCLEVRDRSIESVGKDLFVMFGTESGEFVIIDGGEGSVPVSDSTIPQDIVIEQFNGLHIVGPDEGGAASNGSGGSATVTLHFKDTIGKDGPAPKGKININHQDFDYTRFDGEISQGGAA